MTYSKLTATLCLSALLSACASSGISSSVQSNRSPQPTSSTTSKNSIDDNRQAVVKRALDPQALIDAFRLKDLAYWTGLFEEYKEKTGRYPLQDKIKNTPVLVEILSPKQRQILGGDENNASFSQFDKMNTDVLVAELESGLGRTIEQRFDPTLDPDSRPMGYFYFATKDGYLLWTPCGLCEITPISTYLMDGKTVTLNIASEGMIDKVTKAQSRDDMLNHVMYKQWLNQFEMLSK